MHGSHHAESIRENRKMCPVTLQVRLRNRSSVVEPLPPFAFEDTDGKPVEATKGINMYKYKYV